VLQRIYGQDGTTKIDERITAGQFHRATHQPAIAAALPAV
jgi:hypothetical protein